MGRDNQARISKVKLMVEMSTLDSRSDNLAQRRLIVAKKYLRCEKAQAIHRAMQALEPPIICGVKTVYRDIEALEKLWRQELIRDGVAKKDKELAEIEEAEAECWLKYGATGGREWLAELRGWKERKAKMLGLDAPLQYQVDMVVEEESAKDRLAARIQTLAARVA